MASWILSVFIIAVVATAGILLFKGFGLLKIRQMNLFRLRELRRQQAAAENPVERFAIEVVLQKCEGIRGRWVLQESDLHVLSDTRKLVEEIAAVYHAESSLPVAEARVGRLLQAFLELKDNIAVLTRMKGVRALTQFRLRHLAHLSRIWIIKEKWRQSPLVQALIRLRIYSIAKWVSYALQFTDLSFWLLRMGRYIFYDAVFSIFLVRWYLIVGELSLNVYREHEIEPEIKAESILDELESVVELDSFHEEGISGDVQKIAETSRRKILFDPWALEWSQVRDIYFRLVEDIAEFHHPGNQPASSESGKEPFVDSSAYQWNKPIHEAKLFDLLEGLARLAETVSDLQTKPILHNLLRIRVAHIIRVKDTMDIILDSPLSGWIKKYRLHKIVKFASIIFMTILKKSPGVIFQQVALSLVEEGGKRWVYLYIHDKIALEANRIYREKG